MYIYVSFATGIYHQFDTVVFPNAKSKHWAQRALDWMVSSHHVSQRTCLHFYLENYHTTLSRCNIIPDFNMKNVCDSIVHIFVCLYQQRIFINTTPYVWIDEDLKQVIYTCINYNFISITCTNTIFDGFAFIGLHKLHVHVHILIKC